MGRTRKPDNGIPEVDGADNGTAQTVDAPKKERTGFYMVMGCDANGNPTEVLKVIGTIGRAEKWIDEQKTLIARLYPMACIIRCKPVKPRGIDMVQV